MSNVNTLVINPIQYSLLVFNYLINYFHFVYDFFGVAWSPASRTTERHVMVNEALSITKMALAQVTVHPKVRQDARMLQAVCQTYALYCIILHHILKLSHYYILHTLLYYSNHMSLLLFLLLLLTLLLLQLLFTIVIVCSNIQHLRISHRF